MLFKTQPTSHELNEPPQWHITPQNQLWSRSEKWGSLKPFSKEEKKILHPSKNSGKQCISSWWLLRPHSQRKANYIHSCKTHMRYENHHRLLIHLAAIGSHWKVWWIDWSHEASNWWVASFQKERKQIISCMISQICQDSICWEVCWVNFNCNKYSQQGLNWWSPSFRERRADSSDAQV